MKIKFSPLSLPKSGTLVLLASAGAKLARLGRDADEASGGHITKAIKVAKFDGEKNKVIDIIAPANLAVDRVIVLGVGEPEKLTAHDAQLLGGAIEGRLRASGAEKAVIAAQVDGDGAITPSDLAALIASGARLRSYDFDQYKTTNPNKKQALSSIAILCERTAAVRRAFTGHDAVARGVHLARDLVNEPANTLHPVAFAARAAALRKLGLKVTILTDKDMKKLGMGALLGVAEGSVRPARMAVMRWNGTAKSEPPLAFVGKGVTFDTGGISIKPSSGMEDMKGDMGGAACVTGLMAALAGRKAKVNAVGVIGLVENMPGGAAQRPGDIVKSMSGQTIAVLNTDAEGRLVLADALWYTQSRFKPRFMINLATLTGAILIALGKEHAGLFSNDDELAARLFDAGQASGEKVWRLPLTKGYDKLIESDIADMKNIGGRLAGSITAAQFLQRFVNNVPWAHLDVAGTAMAAEKTEINQSWGSGWGVRLLNQLVKEHYEK